MCMCMVNITPSHIQLQQVGIPGHFLMICCSIHILSPKHMTHPNPQSVSTLQTKTTHQPHPNTYTPTPEQHHPHHKQQHKTNTCPYQGAQTPWHGGTQT